MTGAITDLKVAGKLAVRATKARLQSELDPAPDLVRFRKNMQVIVDSAPPGRIVLVWLIANSLLQRGTGTCDYADIVLQNDEEKIRVI